MVVTVDMSGKQSIVGGVILGSLVECKQNSKIGSIVSIAAAAAAAAACVDDDADSRGRRRCFEQKNCGIPSFSLSLVGRHTWHPCASAEACFTGSAQPESYKQVYEVTKTRLGSHRHCRVNTTFDIPNVLPFNIEASRWIVVSMAETMSPLSNRLQPTSRSLIAFSNLL